MDEVNLVICGECGKPTSEPPFEKWNGYCPRCVVKMNLHYIPDEDVRQLIEMYMESHGEGEGIAIVMGNVEGIADATLKSVLEMIMDKEDVRSSIRRVCDLGDQKAKEESLVKPKRVAPVVRNNPKWG